MQDAPVEGKSDDNKGSEEGESGGGRRVKVGKANFVIACDSLKARGVQSAVKIRN